MEAAIQAVAKLTKKYGKLPTSITPRRISIPRDRVVEIQIPGDGNCFFAAMAVGYSLVRGARQSGASASGTPKMGTSAPGTSGKIPLLADRAAYGSSCRTWFLRNVEHWMEQGKSFQGLDLPDMLLGKRWNTKGAYLAGMRPPITGRHQWGGFPEAIAMSHAWNVKVAFWVEDVSPSASGAYFMLCEPVGPDPCTEERRISLVWRRTHYDLLVVPFDLWQDAQVLSKD